MPASNVKYFPVRFGNKDLKPLYPDLAGNEQSAGRINWFTEVRLSLGSPSVFDSKLTLTIKRGAIKAKGVEQRLATAEVDGTSHLAVALPDLPNGIYTICADVFKPSEPTVKWDVHMVVDDDTFKGIQRAQRIDNATERFCIQVTLKSGDAIKSQYDLVSPVRKKLTKKAPSFIEQNKGIILAGIAIAIIAGVIDNGRDNF